MVSLKKGAARIGLRAGLIGASTILGLSALAYTAPAQAATAFIGAFRATCGTFSVNVAVNGVTGEFNGLDRFRYQIVDGNNKKLYLEDATRPPSVTIGNNVVGISYDDDGVADGPPGANPVRFQVLDLDVNGAVTGVLFEGSYNADCLPPSGAPTFSGDYRPPNNGISAITATTPIYSSPNGSQIQNLTVEAGKTFITTYKSPDSAWLAIFIGSSDLVWIPTRAASTDLGRIPVKPNRIENFYQPPPGQPFPATPPPGVTVPTLTPTSIPIVIQPGTITARTTASNLRLRTLPNTTSVVITRIPYRGQVIVYGKDASGRYYKVQFNGAIGWASASYLRLENTTKAALPVVT